MAKKTTTRKGSSRRKNPAEEVEDAQIVGETAQDSADDSADDTVNAAGSDKTGADEAVADTPDQSAADAATSDDIQADETETGEDKAPEVDVTTTAVTPTDVAQPEQSQSGGGVMALIFGGVVAGAIGFFAAIVGIGVDEPALPEPVDLSGIEQSIADQNARLEEMAGMITASSEAVTAVDLSGVEAEVAALGATIAALDARVTTLEAEGPVTGGAVDPALRDDLEDLKSTIAALEAENEAAKADARSAAEATLRRAAVTQIETALESGAGFADVLADLAGLGVDVPSALSDAADGVPTLASLQESFPDAARAALADDRTAAAESGETGGLTGFFKSQLGARSLTPQEGDSADAVLSRAEAALRAGRLADALAEIETLPEAAAPAMADWAAMAAGRKDAVNAAKTLSDSLN